MIIKATGRMKFINLLPLLLILIGIEVRAQEFLVEEDLRLNWIFYEKESTSPLPFLANRSATPYAIHLHCDLNKGKAAYLKVTVPPSTSMLIDSKFMEFNLDGRPKYLLLDSLKQVYKKDYITLTLYRAQYFQEPVEAFIGFKFSRPESGLTVNPMVLRPTDHRSDYFKILLLLVFLFFVILRSTFPAELLEFYSLKSIITYRNNDTLLNRFRSVTKIQILIIIYEAALMAALMLIVLQYYKNPLGPIFFLSWNPIFGWLVLFVITFLALWAKYIAILFFSVLFNVFERANFYFIEYNRITLLFYSLIFLLVGFSFINYEYSISSLIAGLSAIVFTFYFVRMAILYFKLRSTVSINNLHLFSYLCATELVPIVIGLNFFLK